MFQGKQIISTCENCGHPNVVQLNHFVGVENIFENKVVATCQSCRQDFIVDLYEAEIQ